MKNRDLKTLIYRTDLPSRWLVKRHDGSICTLNQFVNLPGQSVTPLGRIVFRVDLVRQGRYQSIYETFGDRLD
jgi:hypothetical protein